MKHKVLRIGLMGSVLVLATIACCSGLSSSPCALTTDTTATITKFTPKLTKTQLPAASSTPKPAKTPSPTKNTPSLLNQTPPIILTEHTVQDATDGQEFYFDIRKRESGIDLSGYTLEITLRGGDGRNAQLFFKDCDFKNVYSIAQPIPDKLPIQFNPASDPREVDEFSDFTCIAAVGVKIFDNAKGIKIVSAQLIGR
jgi:hypothetical protein